MSKIGKQPVKLLEGVTAEVRARMLEVKGKLGALTLPILPFIAVQQKDGALVFTAASDKVQARANWGTMRALAANAVKGVSEGFSKALEIEGIGFRAAMEGKTLVLNVGFTHPVKFITPEGITVAVEKGVIKVSGIDRAQVGEVAANIRKIKKPEPYQGKGIRYQGEVIRRKAGKKVAGAGATAAAA
ncbi:MAG: 50S ribosomal protein L6 [Candidatus Harrisonbacteria bacterium]|nr:50S ribosomal protein L6 [Candidatus Harrisonbacteria bacterium]